MEVSQSALALMLLWSFLFGILLGLFYDILRMTRVWLNQEFSPRAIRLKEKLATPRSLRWFPDRPPRVKPNKKTRVVEAAFLFLEDVLFCLFCGITVLLLLYQTNDGQLRLSAITTLIGGFALYLATASKLFRLLSDTLIVLIIAMIIWTVGILTYPVAVILRRFYHWLLPIWKRLDRWTKQNLCQAKTRIMSRLKQQHAKKTIGEPALTDVQLRVSRTRKPNGPHSFSRGHEI